MITVCYCGNKKIFHGLLMSALSLAQNSSESLRIIVLSMDLSEKNAAYIPFSENQIKILTAALKYYNEDSYAELIDVTGYFNKYFLGGKNEKNGYTPYASIRLFLDLLPDIPEKLVYLDIDTVCTGDIKELYDVDVSEYEFAAALDYMGHFWINKEYCNSGVLLLNMKKIKETGLFEKCRNAVTKKKMIMPDQSALNYLCQAKLILPRRFNEQRDRKEDTVVKHFCKGIRYIPFFRIYNVKQWQREKVRSYLKIDWMEELYEMYDEICAHSDIDA
ncbi:MAG: glycosyltransferase family 8 protein [Candidatus Coproplasma sp.]